MADLSIRCGDPRLDALAPRIRRFLEQDIAEYNMMGRVVRGYRSPDSPSIWLRDHSDIMRGGRYWEKDLRSVVDHFAETQAAGGWFFDNFATKPEKPPCERENWARYIRVPVEADVEFRFVKAVFLAWQATGDDRWLARMLPHMERGLAYVLTDPWRWDPRHRLVKRAFTIDTWDFDYTAGRTPWLNFQVDDRTFWGIMHGDNSGYYEAFRLMSLLYARMGKRSPAAQWKRRADGLRARANRLCFNGRFYSHRIPLVPAPIAGIDEKEQLSLSNPMDINRGMATHTMAVRILQEYRARQERTHAFAPWFSIDPPFPAGIFGDEKIVPGAYCNGGIMPLVGGELARAAFEHGFETFGVEQLLRYEELTRNNESYLWYFPDGRQASVETSTSPEATPTDGWGSSAMLYALVEGLAGVVDRDSLFRRVCLSPRWLAAGRDEAAVTAVYGPSGAAIEYRQTHDPLARRISLDVRGRSTVDLHLLLPPASRRATVTWNGRPLRGAIRKVEESRYVDAVFQVQGKGTLAVSYR